MKQIFTLSLTFLFFTAFAQVSFFDDFESYDIDDYIDLSSDDWNTWNNQPGSKSDCRVTDEKASSGSKSLKVFSKDGLGGPKDLLLRFKGVHSTGVFTNKFDLFIPNGNKAYFNYQANFTQGTQTTLHTTFRENGMIEVKNSENEVIFTVQYPVDEWFTFQYEINLDENIWLVRINGNCSGSFQNTIAKVASMNIYAVEGNDNFYLDDMSFNHDPEGVSIDLDAKLNDFSLEAGGIIGVRKHMKAKVENSGNITISSLKFRSLINSKEYFDEYDGLSLAPGKVQEFDIKEPFIVEEGDNDFYFEIAEVNGQVDDQQCNNVASFSLSNPIESAPYKAVIIEEGTGTWCPWCVRGTVFMDRFSHRYEPYFIPIAVHNGDPMTIPEYDNFVTSWPEFRGFPGMIIGRQPAIGFGVEQDVYQPFITELMKWPNIALDAGLTYDINTNKMEISVFVEFLKDIEGDFHLNLVLTEDGVTGTGPGYAQANAYAGGTNGPMGGYENLPPTVPADQMVYDHVARAVYGLTPTSSNTIKGSFKKGDVVQLKFTHNVADDQNINNMFIIPILNEGTKFINAREISFKRAQARGILSTEDSHDLVDNVTIIPNPTNDVTKIAYELSSPVDQIIITLSNNNGQAISNYSSIGAKGLNYYSLDLKDQAPGMYFVSIRAAGKVISKRIMKIQ